MTHIQQRSDLSVANKIIFNLYYLMPNFHPAQGILVWKFHSSANSGRDEAADDVTAQQSGF